LERNPDHDEHQESGSHASSPFERQMSS
jgi:hypothetical protein